MQWSCFVLMIFMLKKYFDRFLQPSASDLSHTLCTPEAHDGHTNYAFHSQKKFVSSILQNYKEAQSAFHSRVIFNG